MSSSAPQQKIRVLLVDDIPETRENIKKLLMFEPDIEVVGAAGTGREGLDMAKETQPNVVLMDINMPDMDGIQATEAIATAVPTAAVVMMSVQSEADYLRRAMLAGASDFLTKPISGDDLYSTIRKVHERKQAMISTLPIGTFVAGDRTAAAVAGMRTAEKRLGQIVVVYSPQGGAGVTTIATNLAAGLMREGVRVLLIDANLQFGDVGVFLNLQGQTTLADLCKRVEDLDMELAENVLVSHASGLRVMLGPARPEYADDIRPHEVIGVVQKLSQSYDFVIVDTSNRLDEVNVGLFDLASKILLVCTPTLSGVKNVRFVVDLFDKFDYPADKTLLVLNRVMQERDRGRVTIPTELIEKNLKIKALAQIPLEERVVLHAVNRGVPVIAVDKDRSRPPAKELVEMAEKVRAVLVGEEGEDQTEKAQQMKSAQQTGLGSLFRRPS